MRNKLIKKCVVLGAVVLNLVGLMGKGVYAGGGSGYDPYQDESNPVMVVRSEEFNKFKNSMEPFWFHRSCMLPFSMRREETNESYYGLSDEQFQVLRNNIYDLTVNYFKTIRSKVEDDSDFLRVKKLFLAYFRKSIAVNPSDIYIKEKIDITDSFCSLLFNAYMKIILKANSMDSLEEYFRCADVLNDKLKLIGKHMDMFFPHDGHDDCFTAHDSTYMRELPEKAVLYEEVLQVVENYLYSIPRRYNV